MIKAQDIMNYLENYYPLRLAAEWDNCGLQWGHPDKPIKKVVFALDLTEDLAEKVVENKTDMIITHHPFIFSAIKNINFAQTNGRIISTLIKADVVLYSAHTNLDAGERGLNQYLAEQLGLRNITLLDNNYIEKYYKIATFVPDTHVDEVRQTLVEAGAGFIGNYSDCSFMTKGIGTFKPGPGTNPYIGSVNLLEKAEETKLETIVSAGQLNRAVENLKNVHPYEEVAYDIFELTFGKSYSCGRLGELNKTLSLAQLTEHVKKVLNLRMVKVSGNLEKPVKKIATVSGAGVSFLKTAAQVGADVLITGDVKYHDAQEAEKLDIALIDAGHQGTEKIVVDLLQYIFKQNSDFADIKFTSYKPTDLLQFF